MKSLFGFWHTNSGCPCCTFLLCGMGTHSAHPPTPPFTKVGCPMSRPLPVRPRCKPSSPPYQKKHPWFYSRMFLVNEVHLFFSVHMSTTKTLSKACNPIESLVPFCLLYNIYLATKLNGVSILSFFGARTGLLIGPNTPGSWIGRECSRVPSHDAMTSKANYVPPTYMVVYTRVLYTVATYIITESWRLLFFFGTVVGVQKSHGCVHERIHSSTCSRGSASPSNAFVKWVLPHTQAVSAPAHPQYTFHLVS